MRSGQCLYPDDHYVGKFNPSEQANKAAVTSDAWSEKYETCMAVVLTIDSQMHPAAIVEGVILLLQHEDLTLIPALVVWTHILYPQGGLAV